MQDIQDYINSGILELYALGDLTSAERAEVDAQAARHPEVRRELEQVQDALGVYATAHAITPPAGMRERVLGHFAANLNTPYEADAPVASTATSRLRSEVDEMTQTRPAAGATISATQHNSTTVNVEQPATRSMWAMAASVALLLSLLGNFVLYSRWQNANSELLALESKQTQFAATQASYQQKLGEIQQQNAILRSEEFKAVALAGTPAAPSAKARVLYNPASRKVYVDVRNLPPLPTGKQYQLWALDKGKPVDAGTLAAATASGDSLQQMKDIASAQAFAMTVEPEGGSVNPTLSTMTVVGNI